MILKLLLPLGNLMIQELLLITYCEDEGESDVNTAEELLETLSCEEKVT